MNTLTKGPRRSNLRALARVTGGQMTARRGAHLVWGAAAERADYFDADTKLHDGEPVPIVMNKPCSMQAAKWL